MPDGEGRNLKVWTVHRSPALGVYYIELARLIRLQRLIRADLSVLVLRGRLKVRVAASERIVEAGAYVSIPRATPFRIVRVGPKKALLAVFLSPDSRMMRIHESFIPQPIDGL